MTRSSRRLRQAKGAGNRNIELGHWMLHLLQKDRTDLALTADHFKLDRAKLLARRDGRRQRLSQERDGNARHFQPGRRRARPRLALRDAAVRRDADPHRPSPGRDAEIARTAARAARTSRRNSARFPADELAAGHRSIWARIGRGQSAADGRLGPRRRRRGRDDGRARRQGHDRARPLQPGSDRQGEGRRAWTRSSAATTKSARSSTC